MQETREGIEPSKQATLMSKLVRRCTSNRRQGNGLQNRQRETVPISPHQGICHRDLEGQESSSKQRAQHVIGAYQPGVRLFPEHLPLRCFSLAPLSPCHQRLASSANDRTQQSQAGSPGRPAQRRVAPGALPRRNQGPPSKQPSSHFFCSWGGKKYIQKLGKSHIFLLK